MHIFLDKKTTAKLKALTQETRRSATQEVIWLIEQALSAQPVKQAASK